MAQIGEGVSKQTACCSKSCNKETRVWLCIYGRTSRQGEQERYLLMFLCSGHGQHGDHQGFHLALAKGRTPAAPREGEAGGLL